MSVCVCVCVCLQRGRHLSDTYVETFEELKEGCGRSLLSKSLLYMQQAFMLGTDSPPTEEQRTLLDVSCVVNTLVYAI